MIPIGHRSGRSSPFLPRASSTRLTITFRRRRRRRLSESTSVNEERASPPVLVRSPRSRSVSIQRLGKNRSIRDINVHARARDAGGRGWRRGGKSRIGDAGTTIAKSIRIIRLKACRVPPSNASDDRGKTKTEKEEEREEEEKEEEEEEVGVCKGVSSGGKWPRLPHRCSQTIPFQCRRRSLARATTTHTPGHPLSSALSTTDRHHSPLLSPPRHPLPFLRFERERERGRARPLPLHQSALSPSPPPCMHGRQPPPGAKQPLSFPVPGSLRSRARKLRPSALYFGPREARKFRAAEFRGARRNM